jgi:uncharacterized membrane protein
MHDPVDDPNNYKWNSFYFNREDPRILVPKRLRLLGWTFNFAHKESYMALVLLLVVVFILIIL